MLRLQANFASCLKNALLYHRTISDSSRKLACRAIPVDIKADVREALERAPQTVVALESTIITHGMPYPANLETALEVEEVVRQTGATPATISILDGRIQIGTDRSGLSRLAKSSGSTIKTSRRDMAYVLSKGHSGGTTVAGTLIAADMVGIRIFATGGLGGVHRGGESTLDVSADLIELGRSPVAVVSSGVKSILDIPRTLEYLETQGVCVASYQCPGLDFPAFYTRSSGCKAAYNLNNAREAAQMLSANHALGLRSGFLIGVPIPEKFALDEVSMNEIINQALAEADRRGIRGKEVTPFILAAVSKLTQGKSLESNIALIKNNARVAAEIAVELGSLENDTSESVSSIPPTNKDNSTSMLLNHRVPVS